MIKTELEANLKKFTNLVTMHTPKMLKHDEFASAFDISSAGVSRGLLDTPGGSERQLESFKSLKPTKLITNLKLCQQEAIEAKCAFINEGENSN